MPLPWLKGEGQVFSDKGLGQAGEGIAAEYLVRNGFRILERNYRCRLGEIDLIVERKKVDEILFVEVKTRRSTDAVSPRELVSPKKQRSLTRTAQHYLASMGGDRSADFALLIVDWSGSEPSCELIEGIFFAACGY